MGLSTYTQYAFSLLDANTIPCVLYGREGLGNPLDTGGGGCYWWQQLRAGVFFLLSRDGHRQLAKYSEGGASDTPTHPHAETYDHMGHTKSQRTHRH